MCHGLGTDIVMCVMMRQVKHDTLHSDRTWALATRHLGQQRAKIVSTRGIEVPIPISMSNFGKLFNSLIYGAMCFLDRLRLSETERLATEAQHFDGWKRGFKTSETSLSSTRQGQRRQAAMAIRSGCHLFLRGPNKIFFWRSAQCNRSEVWAIRCSIDTLLFFCSSNGTHLPP